MQITKDRQWQIDEGEAGMRLDKWLAAANRLGSRSRALKAIERGKIFVNGAEQTSSNAGRILQMGDIVGLWLDRPGSSQKRYSERQASGLHLLYEDQSLIVINKPPGLLTVPLSSKPDEPSLYGLVKNHLRSTGKQKPLIVHRLDRDTSGLVIIGKTVEAQQQLKSQFERRSAGRIYLAVVYGHPQPDSGIWKDFLVWDQDKLKQRPAKRRDDMPKEAICHYRIVERFKETSLLEVRLVTGKRNQIRIQAGMRGHPLIGEKMYLSEQSTRSTIQFDRQALHAHRLSFLHPIEGKPMSFEAEIPSDLQALLGHLRVRNNP